jgi:hypothetical protein
MRLTNFVNTFMYLDVISSFVGGQVPPLSTTVLQCVLIVLQCVLIVYSVC